MERSSNVIPDLHIKIFCDGANLTDMLSAHRDGVVSGFTTNPTLMRKAGILDYEVFAREVLAQIPDAPLSLEVFADDFDSMYAQARKINAWGDNVYVKIPITNTLGDSAIPLIQRLNGEGVKVNATAILTREQVEGLSQALRPETPSIVSIFAGRIADTGREPGPMMRWAVELLKPWVPRCCGPVLAKFSIFIRRRSAVAISSRCLRTCWPSWRPCTAKI